MESCSVVVIVVAVAEPLGAYLWLPLGAVGLTQAEGVGFFALTKHTYCWESGAETRLRLER